MNYWRILSLTQPSADVSCAAVADGQPVISVDTKKEEIVGEYDNGGVEYQPEGHPERVLVHDFVDPAQGRPVPHGIFDQINNEGWVSVGDNADTPCFAVNSIRLWWHNMGHARFPKRTGC